MPDTTQSVSEQFDTAVDAAVTQHSESPSVERGTPPSAGSTAGTPAPAVGAGSAPHPPESSSPDAATTQPSDPDEAVIQDDAVWQDLDKRRTVLNNARAKEAARVGQQLRERVEGVLGFSMDDENAIGHVQLLNQNPHAYVRKLAAALGYEVQPAAQPNARPTPAQPTNGQGWQRPKPSLIAQDGTPAYAQPEIDNALDHLLTQIQTLQQQMNPLQKTQQDLEVERIQSWAYRSASQEIETMKKWEGFEELRPRIAQMMQADGRVTPLSAYNTLLQNGYLKERDAKIRKSALTDIQKAPAIPPKGGPSSLHSRGKSGDRPREDFDQATDRIVAELSR